MYKRQIPENKFAAVKALASATPGAGQTAAVGTGAEALKQGVGVGAEKGLARSLVPFVGTGLAGMLAGAVVGILVPSELGDGSLSGQMENTLKKHFPEANHETLTAKIIMFNKINDRNALQFPDKRTIHSLARTNIKDLQKQLEEKVASLSENVEITPEEASETNDQMGEIISTAVNNILNALDDEDPSKNRQTGLNIMGAIKKELQNPERLQSFVADIANDLRSELTESKNIKVKIK